MFESFKKKLSVLIPNHILRIFLQQKAKLMMKWHDDSDSGKIFETIYRKKCWSTDETKHIEFWSGSGSEKKFTKGYESVISRFILEHNVKTVVDLGCGDFQVGKRLLEKTEFHYIGVDVVDDLIKQNSKNFSKENISFVCRDISRDELPDGDLCLMGHVLQHLNNTTVLNILSRVQKYPYCIITEVQHRFPKVLNLDIKSGPWTRTLFQSGLYLDKPPISKKIKTLYEIPVNKNTVVRTFLLIQ